jgi:hypothetical protein
MDCGRGSAAGTLRRRVDLVGHRVLMLAFDCCAGDFERPVSMTPKLGPADYLIVNEIRQNRINCYTNEELIAAIAVFLPVDNVSWIVAQLFYERGY